MVYTLMRQVLAVYKYNIKRSNIYSMYKMCTDNNKIRLFQHERASNSQSSDTLSDQCQPTCRKGSAKCLSIRKLHSETTQHMRWRHFSISHAFLCNSRDISHSVSSLKHRLLIKTRSSSSGLSLTINAECNHSLTHICQTTVWR